MTMVGAHRTKIAHRVLGKPLSHQSPSRVIRWSLKWKVLMVTMVVTIVESKYHPIRVRVYNYVVARHRKRIGTVQKVTEATETFKAGAVHVVDLVMRIGMMLQLMDGLGTVALHGTITIVAEEMITAVVMIGHFVEVGSVVIMTGPIRNGAEIVTPATVEAVMIGMETVTANDVPETMTKIVTEAERHVTSIIDDHVMMTIAAVMEEAAVTEEEGITAQTSVVVKVAAETAIASGKINPNGLIIFHRN